MRLQFGAYCVQPGVTWDTLEAADGFWRASNESLTFYRCLLPTHCGRGRTGECLLNRAGVLCMMCKVRATFRIAWLSTNRPNLQRTLQEGYRSATSTGACEPCPEKSTAIGVSILLVVLVVLAFLLLYYIVLRSDKPMRLADEEWQKRLREWDLW